jgi:hypothetical protein
LRGRSAAAATLSMAKDAAVASTNFIMTIPLVSGQTSTFGSPEGSNRRGTPPSSHHHLARAVSTAARLNDALTELATQRKSACIKANADPFQESVARIARTWRWEADRKAVLNATSAPAVLGDRFWRTSYGLRAADFDSNFRQNIANCGTRRQSLLPQVSGNGADAEAEHSSRSSCDSTAHPLGHRPARNQQGRSRDESGCRGAMRRAATMFAWISEFACRCRRSQAMQQSRDSP